MIRRINTFWWLAVVLLVAGCASHQIEITVVQGLAIEILPSQTVRLIDIDVWEDAQGVSVRGKVCKLHEFKLPGHVRVVVYSSRGEVLEQATGRMFIYASRRGGPKTALFGASLENRPPGGSVIRVQYQSSGSGSG